MKDLHCNFISIYSQIILIQSECKYPPQACSGTSEQFTAAGLPKLSPFLHEQLPVRRTLSERNIGIITKTRRVGISPSRTAVLFSVRTERDKQKGN